MKKLFSLLLLGATLLSPFSAHASLNNTTAKTYLEAHANNPWSTMALSVLGSSSIPTDYLKTVSNDTAIGYTAPILALTSLDKDPRTFGNTDYVAALKGFYSGGQIGDASTINDDIFGLLALIASGEDNSDSVVTGTKNFILAHQQPNGGWGFASSGGSDSNMTSTAIAALIASGVAASDTHIQDGLDYLKTAQNDDGGFTYDPQSQYGTASDSSSTAWVLWALKAAGISPSAWTKSNHTPTEYLESMQTQAGYFTYQQGSPEDAFSATTTAYAVIGLSGKTIPLKKISKTPTFEFRIEGKDNTICSGRSEGPTALDVVKKASATCDFTYHIAETGFGPYLDQINNDKAAGLIGWLYLVNYSSPPVGAAEYTLKPGDSLLWFYGDFNWKPSRLVLSSTEIDSGASTTATVESLTESGWTKLSDAKVFYGAADSNTDADGHAILSLADGYYKVFAEKDGYIRSNGILLTVGTPTGNAVGLTVEVKGQVNDATISFIVNPSNIDFGTMAPGSNNSKSFSIKNTGTVNVTVKGAVSGDAIFTNNLTLDDSAWADFQKQIAIGQEQPTNAKLSIPGNYADGEGIKSGTITFWATGE